ncbi:lycopene cyclase family protein [Haloechinothrix sp. LS1_15]|uniref:lycopene cyclase family protein n=1 Tax=Haloechinothrix sp. LS1_15 TaxID=2652248 RepID=UPI002944FE27|nr:lycopene cyclase family protein [Haloechinothrix sp. LS1_15]MDV6013207.1 lycopene cyclase family protein [Haloechinothrix sp. LS1_15]
MFDIAMIGGGPSGWALASSCAAAGLDTALIDERPHRVWSATYGAWRDEIPDPLTPAIATMPGITRTHAMTGRTLPRQYVVLDNVALARLLHTPDVTVVASRVTASGYHRGGACLRTTDQRQLHARLVVDATGARRRRSRQAAEQTAVGVTVPAEYARRLVPDAPEAAWIMDWRQAVPEAIPPTFLYALPVGPDTVLLEETSLARRPGLGFDVLARRLRTRLAAAGITQHAGPVEQVRIPLDAPVAGAGPPSAHRGPMRFGAAAGLTHPATGYQLVTALTLAPRLAAVLAEHLPGAPHRAAAEARYAMWPPRALAVHALRRMGLRALLRMPAAAVPEFFEHFFELPAELQRAYLSGREDPRGTATAMAALFDAVPWRLRRYLA